MCENPHFNSDPPLYHLRGPGGGGGCYTGTSLTLQPFPHHHGNSRSLLIEATVCFYSWCSSSGPRSPIPNPEARLQRWQNTPLPDFLLDDNSSWSPCDLHIIQEHKYAKKDPNAHTHTYTCCHSAALVYILKLRHSTSNWQLISTSSYFNKSPSQSE